MKLHHLFIALPCIALASPSDFNASPGYGTLLLNAKAGSEIAMEDIHLNSDIEVENDESHILTYSVGLRNTGGGYHGQVVLWLDPAAADWPIETVVASCPFPDLTPNSARVTSPTLLSLKCSTANVAMVRAGIESGQRLHINSTELFQYTLPVIAADANMDALCTAGIRISAVGELTERYRLTFSAATGSITTLVPGQLLIENPELYELNYQNAGSIQLGMVIRSSQSIRNDTGKPRQSFHLEITSALTLPGGEYQVEGIRRLTLDVLRAATYIGTQLDGYDDPVRDPYNPPNGGGFWPGIETGNRDLLRQMGLAQGLRSPVLSDLMGLFCLHYAINDIQIARGITLDGEFSFRGMNVSVDMKWRDSALKKIAFTMTSRAELTLRITAEAGSKNHDEPLLNKERTVFNALLPPIVIPIGDVGLTLQPVLTGKLGCSLDTPTRIVVPMQTSFETGYKMTWDASLPEGSRVQYTPIHNDSPPAFSGPSIAKALSLQASAWFETSLQVMMGITPADSLVVPNQLGPAVSARVQADFTLSPLATPWWSIDGSLDLKGNLVFKLFGLDIVDGNIGTLHLADLFHRHATSPPDPVNGPRDQAAGNNVRWARAGKWAQGGPTSARVVRVTGTPEDVFVAMRSGIDYSVMMRVDARGNLVWSKGGLIFNPDLLAATPDGGFIVAGNIFGSLSLSKYDGDGNMQWTQSTAFRDDSGGTQNNYPARLLVRETGGGAYEFFVVGSRDNALNILDIDPFLVKFDSTGTLVWAKRFASADAEYVSDAAWMPNGNLVMCGSNKLSPDGSAPPGAGAIDGGWVMIVSPGGDVQRTVRSSAGIGMSWSSVAVATDGNIFTTGTLGLTVLSTLPSLQVGKYDSDLVLRGMVTIGEGSTSDAMQKHNEESPGGSAWNPLPGDPMRPSGPNLIALTGDPAHPGQLLQGLQDFLPDAGATVWDTGRRIAWTPAGIIITGTTALTSSTAAYVAALSDQLTVRWMLAHDLPGSGETLLDMTATNEGIVCVGGSEKYFTTATHTNAGDPGCAWILKLPFDGKVALHPGMGGVDKFLQPLVHDSIGSLDQSAIVGPDMQYHGTMTLANPQPQAQATVPGSLIGAIAPHAFTGWVPLEAGDANAPMTFAEWAAYQGIPGASMMDDFDGDGRSNGQEWFFGGDPFSAQSSSPPFSMTRTPGGNHAFTFTKSHAAKLHLPHLDSSTDLQTWSEVTLPSLTVTPVDAYTDEISFTLPATADVRRFYRTRSP